MRFPRINWGSKYLLGSELGWIFWFGVSGIVLFNSVLKDPPAIEEARAERWRKHKAAQQKARERALEEMAERVVERENMEMSSGTPRGHPDGPGPEETWSAEKNNDDGKWR